MRERVGASLIRRLKLGSSVKVLKRHRRCGFRIISTEGVPNDGDCQVSYGHRGAKLCGGRLSIPRE